MADEKKVIDGEAKETVETKETTPAGEEAKKDDKKKLTCPGWLKKLGRGVEAAAAIFGAIVGGLLIADKATASRRKRKYEEYAASKQAPERAPFQEAEKIDI